MSSKRAATGQLSPSSSFSSNRNHSYSSRNHHSSSRHRYETKRHKNRRDYDNDYTSRSYDNDDTSHQNNDKPKTQIIRAQTADDQEKPKKQTGKKKSGFWLAVKKVKEEEKEKAKSAGIKYNAREDELLKKNQRLEEDVKLYRDKYHAIKEDCSVKRSNFSTTRAIADMFKTFQDLAIINDCLIDSLSEEDKNEFKILANEDRKWNIVNGSRAFLRTDLEKFANREIDKLPIYDFNSGGMIVYAVNKNGADFKMNGEKIEILEFEDGSFTSLDGKRLTGPEVKGNGELKYES